MNFTTTNGQKKNIAALVDKISKELGVETSIVLHFVYTDLERIYSEKLSIHNTKLRTIESEFADLNKRENELKQRIENRSNQIAYIQKSIQDITLVINNKENLLNERKSELEELQKKLNDVNKNLSVIAKEKDQVDYKVMMKSHFIRKREDISFKRIGWILTGFTLIGIIIAILLILNKNK